MINDLKIIETHIHGGFGINFNNASADDLHFFARNIIKKNVIAFIPTLATDSIDNLNCALNNIKQAMQNQKEDEARILGVHLEACFLNPFKKGIHNEKYFLDLTAENFDKFSHHDIIKIVTLAPELDCGLVSYLKSKNIKVQAGHTMALNISDIDATTHHFNAMPKPSFENFKDYISYKALNNNGVYCEIIADFIHNDIETLKMFFNKKNKDKIILISDALPIACSNLDKIDFCGKTIFNNGKDANGVLGGSILTLYEIAHKLLESNILTLDEIKKMLFENQLNYLGLNPSDF
ncbi:MAG: hypothetical protein E7Z91_05200 [Cyanobacteria bacterium SIG30]|nr:hypothetical protein [Cyanobacteria bacterium SIG30]